MNCAIRLGRHCTAGRCSGEQGSQSPSRQIRTAYGRKFPLQGSGAVIANTPCSAHRLQFQQNLLTGKEGQWDATNPQFSVYVDGVLRQGFDVNHHEIRLTDYAQADENHWLFLSAYTGVENFHLIFDAQLRVVDDAITKLYYDLLIPWQTACLLEPSDSSYLELIQTLTETVNLLDLRKPGSDAYYTSTARAEEHLRQRLYTQPRPAEALVCCVGHTHIDVAWLWTLSVTEDKAVRSFSTVLELMRCYPEYIFMSSQPQLYK